MGRWFDEADGISENASGTLAGVPWPPDEPSTPFLIAPVKDRNEVIVGWRGVCGLHGDSSSKRAMCLRKIGATAKCSADEARCSVMHWLVAGMDITSQGKKAHTALGRMKPLSETEAVAEFKKRPM